MRTEINLTPKAVREQLSRIVKSSEFSNSPKLKKFLQFIVEQTLTGRETKIKGYTIALEVYGKTGDFESEKDPIVRVEARRLRRLLDHYYRYDGKQDPILIQVPKGGYVPIFALNRPSAAADRKIAHPDNTLTSNQQGVPLVAVLPFESVCDDAKIDNFAIGLTEEIIADLTHYENYRVFDFRTIASDQDQPFDISDISCSQIVDYVLTGKVQKSGHIVKVTASLADTQAGTHLWAKSYKQELNMTNLFDVQDEITHQVVATIADLYGIIPRVLYQKSRHSRPKILTSYHGILQFQYYNLNPSKNTAEQARKALKKTIKSDPEYALAWAMLAELDADDHGLLYGNIDQPLEQATQAAQRAVKLNSKCQYARFAAAYVHFHKNERDLFLREAKNAVGLNPHAAHIVGFTGLLIALIGEWDHGISLVHQSMKQNPDFPGYFHIANCLKFYSQEDFRKALDAGLLIKMPEFFWDPMLRTAIYGQLGRRDEAKASASELLELIPDFENRGRRLISNFVKINDLVEDLIESIKKVGINIF
jgi:TolB-like protein